MISLSLTISVISLILLVLVYKNVFNFNFKKDDFAREWTLICLTLGIIPIFNLFYILVIALIVIVKKAR